jgi:hypothetical protein
MPYSSNAGIAIATQSAPDVFYPLTDHNRESISFDYEIIERSARMADGTMRKFVVAKKMKINTAWHDLPSGTFAPYLHQVIRTNLAYNPSFESSNGQSYYWDDYNAFTSITSACVLYGTYSALVTSNSSASPFGISNGSNWSGVNNIPISSNLPYYYSIYIAGNPGPMRACIEWYDSSSTLITTSSGASATPSSSSWTRLSASGIAPSNAVSAKPTVYTTVATAPAVKFYADGALFEQSSTLNSYFDGDTSSATTWIGTEGTSQSNMFTATTGNQGYTMTVDGYKGGAWIKDFYETNLFKPVYVRITHSQDTASANAANAFYPSPSASGYEIIQAFMTSLTYEVTKRYTFTDLVNVRIEFTEI